MRPAALLSGALLVCSCLTLHCTCLEAGWLEDAARNNVQRTHSRVNVAMRDQDVYTEDKDGHEYAQKYHHQPHRQHETVEYHHAPAEQQHVLVHRPFHQASQMGGLVQLSCTLDQRAY